MTDDLGREAMTTVETEVRITELCRMCSTDKTFAINLTIPCTALFLTLLKLNNWGISPILRIGFQGTRRSLLQVSL